MCGNKTSQSTSNVSVPENVKAMYTSAADAARTAANRPFQQYSTDPNAFVAGLTGTQQAAIQNTNAAQGSYQPFYNQSVQSLYAGQQAANPLQAQAAQFGLAGAQGVDPSQLGAQQINQYMSPYLNSVVQSTLAPLQQQQQQQQSALVGDQIGAGAFGGDRGRIAQANLAQQQNMATAQIVSGLMNQGYGQALSTAQQQQGVGLGAAQANRAAQQQAAGQMAALGQQGYSQGMGTSQQLANLGTGALQNQLSGAQAQMGMGTSEQQTQQAGLQALYNQFLQQQGYPFQTAQFLTNQMATLGPLYGTTTTKEVPTDLLGNPKASGGAIERKSGGLVPSSEGGAVSPAHAGLGFAYGGSYSPEALAEIIQMQKAMFPFAAESGSRVGGGTGPLGIGLVPANPRPLEYAKFDVRDKSEPSLNEKLLALLNENSTTTKAPASYRGGVAGSSHYAAGGSLPYATDTSYVPQQEEQKDSSGLLGADSSSSTRGGGAAADLVRLQTLLSLFSDDSSSKKNGGVAGRHGYAEDGAVKGEEPPPESSDGFTDWVRNHQEKASKYADERARSMVDPKRSWLGKADDFVEMGGTQLFDIMLPGLAGKLFGDPSKVNFFGNQVLTPPTPGLGLPQEDANPGGLAPPAAAPKPAAAAATAAGPDAPQPQIFKGNDITGAVSDEPYSSQIPGSAAPAAAPKGGGELSPGKWFERNKDWMIPLASGVSGVLEGRGGKFLPAALLSGAAKGIKAYMPLKQQEAALALTQAETATNIGALASSGYNPNTDTYRVYDKNGNPTFVRRPEFLRALDAGTPYKIVPSSVSNPESGVPSTGVAPMVAPSTGVAPPAAAPNATSDAKPNQFYKWSSSDDEAFNKAIRQTANVPNPLSAASWADDPASNPFDDITNSARAVRETTAEFKSLVSTLPKVKEAGGGVPADIIRSVGFNINGLLKQVGIPFQPFDEKGFSDQEQINKAVTALSARAANLGDQRAAAALEALKGITPNMTNSPEGRKKISTSLMVARQKILDLDKYANEWRNKAELILGNRTPANHSGYGLEAQFSRSNENKYGKDKAILEKIYDRTVTKDGIKMPLSTYLFTAGNEINPRVLDQLRKEYGNEILRYFDIY